MGIEGTFERQVYPEDVVELVLVVVSTTLATDWKSLLVDPNLRCRFIGGGWAALILLYAYTPTHSG